MVSAGLRAAEEGKHTVIRPSLPTTTRFPGDLNHAGRRGLGLS